MAYRNGYQRYGQRRGHDFTPGRVTRPNRRAGACRVCAEDVPAFGGNLYREPDGAWSVVHVEASQGGWAMRPQAVTGGCPRDTDKRNAELHAAGFFSPGVAMPRPESERIAERAALQSQLTVNQEPARTSARRGGYAVLNSGAVVRSSSNRCEDAPCCGCCG